MVSTTLRATSLPGTASTTRRATSAPIIVSFPLAPSLVARLLESRSASAISSRKAPVAVSRIS